LKKIQVSITAIIKCGTAVRSSVDLPHVPAIDRRGYFKQDKKKSGL
jgi:hypothetical protein